MRKVKKIFFLIAFILSVVPVLSVFGQDSLRTEMVKYTPDFRFKDGIYLNFEQVRNNRPIPKAKLLTSVDYNDREFFKRLLEMDKIYFYDDMGVRQEVDKKQYLGLCTKWCNICTGAGKFQQDHLHRKYLSFCC